MYKSTHKVAKKLKIKNITYANKPRKKRVGERGYFDVNELDDVHYDVDTE